ncbi:4-hydroxybenzoate polyprenyltransferase, mitochondrial-like isoform X2 [Panonychus citri]|uniref:4-hydroxybenzoate polyprenyltransferase, mitochondrial-like isoform X1 n=1 Tax=Panonychus citri TaxID=50023 RepID=UPI00230709D3|nr:4-hydroxybenzoate polyprenyltransferase, mitochondrial-like isoform X1 [Panonychus citri]XP_053201511.1 4-hydroxybenzoate polyprenyltransferase, mitochondrial-like isoform X2 [Panonychus citri]
MFNNTLRPLLMKCYRHSGSSPCGPFLSSYNLSKTFTGQSVKKGQQLNPDIIEIKRESLVEEFLPIPTNAERTVAKFPKSIQPYLKLMRLHSPTGGLLLLWPGYFGLAFATDPMRYPNPTYLALFGIGTILMRGVGCTINDIVDRHYDLHVNRTKNRPIATGELSVPKAVAFLALQSSLALSILMKFDTTSIILGLSSVGLICIYPFAKKFTYWPQLVLGLTFNWGALLGWSVVTKGNIFLPGAIPLYLACISWTLFYDTIYAHQDRVNDLSIGLKSTAIKFGENTKNWLHGFHATMLTNLIIAGLATGQVWPYYCSLGLASFRLFSITRTLDINNPRNCGQKFEDNVLIGYILFCGIGLSTMIKTDSTKEEMVEDDLNIKLEDVFGDEAEKTN